MIESALLEAPRVRRSHSHTIVLITLSLASILPSGHAHAQAWVSDVGDGTIAVSTQYTRVMTHLYSVGVGDFVDPATGYAFGPGNRAHLGDITTYACLVSGEYVPKNRLAISGDFTYTRARYTGRSPESSFDDGAYHGDLQDASLGARYMMRVHSFVLTPSIDARIPLTGYSSSGHAAAGSGLASLSLGINSGRSLAPFAPQAYAFLNYTRVIVENVGQNSLDRNQWGLGLGTFVTPALSVQGHFQYVDTVDGEDWWLSSPGHTRHQNFAAKATHRRAGLSAGYTLTRHVGLALSWENTISGANVHATHSLTLGASWGFWKPRPL